MRCKAFSICVTFIAVTVFSALKPVYSQTTNFQYQLFLLKSDKLADKQIFREPFNQAILQSQETTMIVAAFEQRIEGEQSILVATLREAPKCRVEVTQENTRYIVTFFVIEKRSLPKALSNFDTVEYLMEDGSKWQPSADLIQEEIISKETLTYPLVVKSSGSGENPPLEFTYKDYHLRIRTE